MPESSQPVDFTRYRTQQSDPESDLDPIDRLLELVLVHEKPLLRNQVWRQARIKALVAELTAHEADPALDLPALSEFLWQRLMRLRYLTDIDEAISEIRANRAARAVRKESPA
jgi:hypothetical protein